MIPNYFDLNDFPVTREGVGDYLMYLGRLIPRKGPHIAAQIADACELPLVVAGAGALSSSSTHISCADGYEIRGKNIRYAGSVHAAERAELLSRARALVVATTYIEPFGGVAVEAMLCGVPVITTDAGAFTETVAEGVTGFRIHSLSEAIHAVDECAKLDSKQIANYAAQRYSLAAVAPQFDRWFQRLATLWGDGWYARELPLLNAKVNRAGVD